MEKAIGYIRVSTSDQENSLEVQESQIRNYAQFKGLEIVEIFVDENISGGTEFNKRPAGKRLNESLSTIKNVIAIKPDRLFRNLKDALITTDEWNSEDIALHIVDLGGASLSTQTALGRLMFSMIISYAEFEKNIVGERTKAVLTHKKKSKKVYCGKVLGFDNVDGELVPNEAEQEIVTLIKNLSLKYTDVRVARILNNVGYRTVTGVEFRPTTIKYIKENKLYTSNQ